MKLSKKKSSTKITNNFTSPQKLVDSVGAKKMQLKKLVVSPQQKNRLSKQKSKTKLIKEVYQQPIYWGLKSSDSCLITQSQPIHEIDDFVYSLSEDHFKNVPDLKIHVLDFVVKKRIVRDSDYDKLYTLLVERFQHYQQTIKSILVEILASLDS